ncbi:hypothetical protein H0H93_007697 [Arthromyces matolae]|nr:hypothetical protein H0H93_007697 [Arthromyces matolae]
MEFCGLATLESDYGTIGIDDSIELPNNTYKSARILGEGYNLYYSVWCHTNEHELYDLSAPLNQVIERLDALLLVLSSCKGPTCIKPWNVLHLPGFKIQHFLHASTESVV